MPRIQEEFMGTMTFGFHSAKNLSAVFDHNVAFSAYLRGVKVSVLSRIDSGPGLDSRVEILVPILLQICR